VGLLLTDELLMGLCGFNAYQVKNGSCERGTKLRKRPMPEVRGALCVDTLAKQIVQITPRRLENFFNHCIQKLATKEFSQKIFMRPVIRRFTRRRISLKDVVRWFGSAKSRLGIPKIRGAQEVQVRLYGWKIWAIYELQTGIL